MRPIGSRYNGVFYLIREYGIDVHFSDGIVAVATEEEAKSIIDERSKYDARGEAED